MTQTEYRLEWRGNEVDVWVPVGVWTPDDEAHAIERRDVYARQFPAGVDQVRLMRRTVTYSDVEEVA